jgi:hypothetical protein
LAYLEHGRFGTALSGGQERDLDQEDGQPSSAVVGVNGDVLDLQVIDDGPADAVARDHRFSLSRQGNPGTAHATGLELVNETIPASWI